MVAFIRLSSRSGVAVCRTVTPSRAELLTGLDVSMSTLDLAGTPAAPRVASPNTSRRGTRPAW
jgi:hypothetical protein